MFYQTALAFRKTGREGGRAKSKIETAAARMSGRKDGWPRKTGSNSMNKSNKSTTKRNAVLLFLCLAFAVSAYGQDSLKHVIGETVAQFAAKEGVDISACHKLKLHTWTCNALISAEHGHRLKIGKEGEWSAGLDGGKLVFYNDNLKK